jgi:ATP-dependent helicase/nuclease subunit A
MIYRESGLMALAAKNGGRENLVLLHSYARKYEASDFKGLYSFISYINEIIESGEEFESASAEAEENAVRLMTVHKSKGLEFSVCILANTSSQGKPSKEKITFSDTFGISLKLLDDTGLALVENPAGKIIDHFIKNGEYEEELRVLYVALTRAREMLYVYGTCKTVETDAYLDKVRNIGEANSPYLITKAKTFLDMVLSTRKFGRLTIENSTPASLHIDPVDPEKIKCDAYDYEKGIVSAVNSFRGEYMVNYSWAEFKTGTYVAMEQKRQ